jgi:hypothetical protein
MDHRFINEMDAITASHLSQRWSGSILLDRKGGNAMSSFQTECLRRSATGGANARILHKALHLAFAIACGLVLAAILRTPDRPASWQRHLLDAESALSVGDRNRARHLYSQASRLAVWQSDWYGALAAACGMSSIERSRGDYFASRQLLIRAMILAEKHQSATALNSVADAFAGIGDHNASAMVKSRLQGRAPGTDSLPLQPPTCK